MESYLQYTFKLGELEKAYSIKLLFIISKSQPINTISFNSNYMKDRHSFSLLSANLSMNPPRVLMGHILGVIPHKAQMRWSK